MAYSFRDLTIWQGGQELLIEIYKITAQYPKEEKYGLVSDTRRSANSIIANIAEAHGRYYYADRARVLYTARGEAEETRSHLSVALAQKYIEKEKFNYLDKKYNHLVMGIGAYIASIYQNKKSGNKHSTNN